MQSLVALLLAAAAACAIARPPGPTPAPGLVQAAGPMRMPPPPPPRRELLPDYLLPRMLLPHYLANDDSPYFSLQPEIDWLNKRRDDNPDYPASENDWLNREIDHISQINEDEEPINSAEENLLRWYSQNLYLQSMLYNPMDIQRDYYNSDSDKPRMPMSMIARENVPLDPSVEAKREPAELTMPALQHTSSQGPDKFALTPKDKGYYDAAPILKSSANKAQHASNLYESEAAQPMVLEPPRQTRQNPNLSKQKHLLEPDLEKLKVGLANKEYRLPVSLLPTDLRWLKVSHPDKDKVDHDEKSSHEEGETKQHHVHVLETPSDPTESIYSVALIAAVGAALTMAIVGFAFGWYTLSKRAKAAADVDYPAYGVTGPTVDTSGDRKLAHSAHMYHYQHQKQQIIAMERNGLDQRTGSVSDPESEEENEEGDYTVYECPGFATTGDMEVKNPMFSEDPTPITPGKCEVVKQQPND